jgi:hypothetical protein
MKIIDCYAHLGLPRFLAAEEFLRVMDRHRVEAAVVCGSERCPDTDELSRAAEMWPDRFRAVGMPLGRNEQEVRDGVTAQMDAGFLGMRMPAGLIVRQPELLEIVGSHGGIPYMLGPDLFADAALLLVEFLERYPACCVCAPHFGGVASVSIFDELPHARRLLEHPRFNVIVSRQGAFDPTELGTLTLFLVREVGWERLLWGSEFPACLWRNESYSATVEWMGQVIAMTEGQRKLFLHDNARRLLLAPPKRPPRRLEPRWNQMHLKTPAPVWLFARSSIDVDEEIHRTLLLAYLSRGEEKVGRYSDFIGGLLGSAARQLEG